MIVSILIHSYSNNWRSPNSQAPHLSTPSNWELRTPPWELRECGLRLFLPFSQEAGSRGKVSGHSGLVIPSWVKHDQTLQVHHWCHGLMLLCESSTSQNLTVLSSRWWGTREVSEGYHCTMQLPAFCVFTLPVTLTLSFYTLLAFTLATEKE